MINKNLKDMAVLCFIVYLIFAFVLWNFNPAEWNITTRYVFVVVTLFTKGADYILKNIK